MRLGLFGGTFDPIHVAHLILADICLESAKLDEIWFIPNARSPHKRDAEQSNPKHRLQMLELAISGNSAFRVCDVEVMRGGISYTVDTLRQIRGMHPDAELFFLMGGDSLADFPNWKAPDRICELATPLIVRRPSFPEPDLTILQAWLTPSQQHLVKSTRIEMPQLEISSTKLRQRVNAGQSIRYRTPRAVEKYIQTHGLYGGSDADLA